MSYKDLLVEFWSVKYSIVLVFHSQTSAVLVLESLSSNLFMFHGVM